MKPEVSVVIVAACIVIVRKRQKRRAAAPTRTRACITLRSPPTLRKQVLALSASVRVRLCLLRARREVRKDAHSTSGYVLEDLRRGVG